MLNFISLGSSTAFLCARTQSDRPSAMPRQFAWKSPTSGIPDYCLDMSTPEVLRLADACVEWHTDEVTARDWIASGKIRVIATPEGDMLVPLSEVARWQGVLGQNGLLPPAQRRT